VNDDPKADLLKGMPRRASREGAGPARAPLGAHGWAGAGAKGEAPELEPRTRAEGDFSPVMKAYLSRFNLNLPQPRGAPPIIATLWFIVSFVVPVLFGAAYYGLIASKQYEAEFHFTVREPLPDGAPSPSGGAETGDFLALLGRTASASGRADTLDNYTVVDYVRSAQAARDLDHRLNLNAMFTKPGVDPFSRYHGAKKAEALAEYWRGMVWSTYDPATGLASVKVRAFSPADAYAIATNLIDLADGVVNNSGRRSRADSLRIAQQEVDGAQSRLTEIQNRMTALRNQLGAIDPTKDEVGGNVELANGLRAQLTQLEGQLRYLSSQLKDPAAPQIARVKAEIAATQSQLASVDARVNGKRSGDMALTAAVGEFEQLDAERRSVEQAYFASLQRLQEVGVSADTQRLYLATYVQPAEPQSSTYPKRFQAIGVLALCCLLIWSIGVLIGKSVLDHIR
jgi:capsular polysaccharide transport system permease protein